MMMWRQIAISWCLAILLATPLAAQSRKESLADIRQELSFFHVDIQRLKTELSTTGNSNSVGSSNGEALERIDAIEGEMRRLAGKVEDLQFKLERVVKDGTARVGDLEFRLVELEGGDVSKLGETTTLGGADILQTTTPMIVETPQTKGNAELAISEQADFDAAKASYDKGDFSRAADQFQTYIDNYPGGVLTGDAHYWRGESLAMADDWSKAARAFLQAFSSAPDGPLAPVSLYRLGVSLDKIGQRNEACLTLNEVNVRYPGTDADSKARADRSAMNCAT